LIDQLKLIVYLKLDIWLYFKRPLVTILCNVLSDSSIIYIYIWYLMAVWRNLLYYFWASRDVNSSLSNATLTRWRLSQWSIFSLGFILSTWVSVEIIENGKEELLIVFLALFLVMVTLASLPGCIIFMYLTDQQELMVTTHAVHALEHVLLTPYPTVF
jgi:hypothetical protein